MSLVFKYMFYVVWMNVSLNTDFKNFVQFVRGFE